MNDSHTYIHSNRFIELIVEQRKLEMKLESNRNLISEVKKTILKTKKDSV